MFIIKAIVDWLYDRIGRWLYPQAAKQRDDLIAARKAQGVIDAQSKADEGKIEDRVVVREKATDESQKVVEQNATDIAKARNDLADKLKQVDDAQSIEEVLKIK